MPGPIEARTGGTIYDRRLIGALSHMGIKAQIINLAPSFPYPTPGDLDAAAAAFAALRPGLPLVVDGLGLGAMPGLAARTGAVRPLVALVHHSLAHETGLDPMTAADLAASERAGLGHAHRVVVTSPATARALAADFAVPVERITVALPGTAPRPRARGSRPPLVLNVGAVTPRKDQTALVRVLATLPDLPWRLVIAGSMTRDPATAAGLRAEIARLGFGTRVDLVGECDEATLDRLFAAADLFASTARYEGYGMAIAEALVAGLPVVAVRGGAVAETLPETAGLLVDADDEGALAAAIHLCLTDRGRRDRLAAGALAAGRGAPTWADAAGRVADVLRAVTGREPWDSTRLEER